MITNNPYIYHPHPLLKVAADDICLFIEQHPQWAELFEQGKMLGVMLVDQRPLPQPLHKGGEYIHSWSQYGLLVAYSGVVNGLDDPEHYFVPPVYDLANPDDFYLQEDEEISAINKKIEECKDEKRSKELKTKRKELSQQLQLKIFSHFNFASPAAPYTDAEKSGEIRYKNILDIFKDAKRGLPPGGSGECAAPRLWQYAIEHKLTPIAMAEFWYGTSPNKFKRVHKQFYPSCIEKCSPILTYQIDSFENSIIQKKEESPKSQGTPEVIFEDEHLIVVEKPAGLLSSPAKDLSQPNVEDWLKARYPDCQLPNMLAHRLDQATSGILVAAKDAQTHKWLQQGFEQRQFHKSYLTWLEGSLPSDCGIIHLPICPNPDDRPRQTVDWQFGKQAVTRYRVLKRTDSLPKGGSGRVFTLVEFMPLTGRTHQLRLHAASPFGLDHPIVGDTLYNITDTSAQESTEADRLMLHAQSITLTPQLQWQRKPSW